MPSESVDPAASADTVREFADVMKRASGATFGATAETDRTSRLVAPLSSVTVRATEYVPARGNVCVVTAPLDVVPSPKSQAYPTTDPSRSMDALPSTDRVRSVMEELNEAEGGVFATTPAPIVK